MRGFANVTFTRPGWRQYLQMNCVLGSRFIKGFILRHELAAYLAAHEQAGTGLDTTCLELHYGDGIYLLLMKCQDSWIITDIWATDAPVAYAPIFLWQRVRQGLQTLLGKVLAGWRSITQGTEGLGVPLPC